MKSLNIIDEIMDAQADLQVALGIHRLDIHSTRFKHPEFIEDRLAKSLARLHRLLEQLGKPMYQPAQHPDIEALNAPPV